MLVRRRRRRRRRHSSSTHATYGFRFQLLPKNMCPIVNDIYHVGLKAVTI